MVKKNRDGNCKVARTWSPELRERDRYGRRWHDGEEYTRVGDEYRPKYIEEDDTKKWEEEGYGRSRATRDVYGTTENRQFTVKSERRRSLGTEAEQDDVPSGKTTKALVHKDRMSKTAESFRYFITFLKSLSQENIGYIYI